MPDPVRRILHVDMDAFYASVEQRDDPALAGLPLAVGGRPESRGVVAAASYEARRFGVFSAMPMSRAVRLCPDLVVVPPHFSRYREVSRQVFAIFRSATPLVEPLSLDEAYLDVSGNNWGILLGVDVARRLKREIREATGLTASAGVAPNKFLAKIASGWKKPDGLTVIAPSRVEGFLQKLAVEALWGVGPVTARKLRAIGISRLIDVRSADDGALRGAVGSQAETLKRFSRGEDDREVLPHRETKSVSCETTYASDLRDLSEIRSQIQDLARQTFERAVRSAFPGRCATIKVRYSDFKTITRSKTEDRAAGSADALAAIALDLLEKTDAGTRPIRLLGVGLHNAEEPPRPEPQLRLPEDR
ncbi:MAG: DNA polymerase IV [Thermoanaerobaculia bacterium]